MSKKAKLKLKLFSTPSPKDFTWDELITLMRSHGFKESCSSGSHYMFDHNVIEYRVGITKTHPSGILKRYQIDAAKDAITYINTEIGSDDEQST